MTKKWIKRGIIGLVLFVVVGGLLFGTDLSSYVRSSAKMTQAKVKDAVPIEFELRRAQDLLEEILPEIHANIQLIAKEEVEIAALKQEIQDSENAIAQQKQRVEKLRNALTSNQSSYAFGNRKYSRQEVADELAAQFENFKEAELVFASKHKLFETREKSLRAAVQLLEKTKSQKRILASRIESLEGQFRLLKASAVGTGIQVDNSKLAQTEKLLGQIKKRLDVAERVLAHESKFVQTIPIDQVSADQLITQVDEYFRTETPGGNPAGDVTSN
ncbi:MAG: signal peptide-containing protein [Planctomycetota bacterium]